MKTIIHVNQKMIRHNLKTGESRPVLTVKPGRRKIRYAMEAIIRDIDGKELARIVYADGVNRKPLNCGARVWIETEHEVSFVGEADIPIICEVE